MAYLFTYFTSNESGDDEKIWFSVSFDGLHWNDLNDCRPILVSDIGTKGIRDPYIVYDDRLKKYFIVATDLKTSSGDWGEFSSRGSRSILVWSSTDLISWEGPESFQVGIEGAGCVWAPEAVFCEKENKWLVFWASNVKEAGETQRKQRIYAAFTEDFCSFGKTFKFLEAETDVIDTTVAFENGWYYRFSKDEANKLIIIDRCRNLIPDKNEAYEKISSKLLSDFPGLEGPEIYYLRDKGKWCLIADRYRTNSGYVPMITDSLEKAEFSVLSPDEYDFGKMKKRHGGIIEITEEKAKHLLEYKW